MLRQKLSQIVRDAILSLQDAGTLPRAEFALPEIADTKQPEHGHFASNFAMVQAKSFGMNPRQLAELVAGELTKNDQVFSQVEIAGPGFLNFRLTNHFLGQAVQWALQNPKELQRGWTATPHRINVEFVSVNPNGPITIGSGRGAAYGSTLCNVLEACGHTVHREYYINDGVNSEQMRLFAESVKALALGMPIPENGYKGDYVREVAERIKQEYADKELSNTEIGWWMLETLTWMVEAQREALRIFGVEFDTWFSEQSLHDAGMVWKEVEATTAAGVADSEPRRNKLKLGRGGVIEDVEVEVQSTSADDAEGEGVGSEPTIWLRSTKFGDDQDRVLRRRDGRLAYIASDVAYHKDKLNRPENADRMITVLGPDHHGYIVRLQAVVAAMLLADNLVNINVEGAAPLTEIEAKIYTSPEDRERCRQSLEVAKQKLKVQIFQLVRFLKDGKPAPMRKRDGNIFALIDLVQEIGNNVLPNGTEEERLAAGKDVARFFYLMRSHDSTFDFDLDLAERQSDENPVFYVQYAHARICSLIDKAAEQGITVHASSNWSLLEHPAEVELIRKVSDLPWEITRCEQDFGVHRLATYSIELARAYHHFYDSCRVLQSDQPELTQARLGLCRATQLALQSSLNLLGVSAPQRM